ncbi:alpha/beta-hydrolase [Trematosphaeria pertusa]|uniref:Alpha/beta-hydrolase n=1 Tax=Trematosphaeria pertusa TaxID=390896 RepID=A0A6A6I3C0_9PLEO|nr:alpha/beta-hydrolase [Trematosphaeria pertusa]KAF2244383.1 alpha/beta-hydrolase [Trematosphaeria pertusa]
MAATKPTIVLIHGGWHVPATYSKLAEALRSSGYEVHVPRLASVNETRPPNADLSTDTALIRSYVENLVQAGRDVVAIMHSYGGQVGTNALHGLSAEIRSKEGKTGGITQLVYMCAFALPEGGSMVGKVKEFGHEHLLPLAFDFADDNTVLHRDPKTLLVGEAPGLDDGEIEAYVNSHVRWNGTCMYQEVSHCAWREAPVNYIYTTLDMTVPLDYQKSMVEKMQEQGREVQTFQLETGHCPNLTATAQVVDVVKKIAG